MPQFFIPINKSSFAYIRQNDDATFTIVRRNGTETNAAAEDTAFIEAIEKTEVTEDDAVSLVIPDSQDSPLQELTFIESRSDSISIPGP